MKTRNARTTGILTALAVALMIAGLAADARADATATGDVLPDLNPSGWELSTHANIGKTGSGTLSINGGSDVSILDSIIGNNSGSTGTVTVDGAGSNLTNSGDLYVGISGSGTLTITNGGAVSNNWSTIGAWSGANGTAAVDGPGSSWTNSGNLEIGHQGSGSLAITNGGLVSVAGTLTIDNDGGGDSFINMATGGMLALLDSGGTATDLTQFLALIDGTDAINYWDGSAWADITGATYNTDYTLIHITNGNLADYTVLTVGVPDYLTIQMPNGGEMLVSGDTYEITWTYLTENPIMIHYSIDGGENWELIAANLVNDGGYTWDPVPAVTSDQCIIEIKDMLDTRAFDCRMFKISQCAESIPGDINNNCYVNLADLSILAQNWLACSNPSDPSCNAGN